VDGRGYIGQTLRGFTVRCLSSGDGHRPQVDTCWGEQMEKQPQVPQSSYGEEPANGESSGQLQAL
jgi:hypothetical protein